MLTPTVVQHLTADDDLDCWDIVTRAILTDAVTMWQESGDDVVAQIGSCSHWIRPHQMRWRNANLAWPMGYDKTTTGFFFSALPEHDWSEYVRWNGTDWEPGRPKRRSLILRISIPARTARHKQAAVHTIWTPRSPQSRSKFLKLFGFRNGRLGWTMTATQAFDR